MRPVDPIEGQMRAVGVDAVERDQGGCVHVDWIQRNRPYASNPRAFPLNSQS